jgi:phage tail-like protein
MTTSRGLSLLIQPDQWARCAHTGTTLLPAGGVELTWDDSATAGPGRVCGPGCADRGSCEHRPGATAGSRPGPAGLAFDRWCRAYRSRPADGRVDVVDDLAPGPAPTSATVPTSAGSRPCAGGLRRPVGVAVDRRDRLYIAELGAGAVHVVDLWAERVLRKVPFRDGRPVDVVADCGRAVVLTDQPALVLVDGRRGPQPGPELVRPCYPTGLVAHRVASGPLVLWRAQDGSGAVTRPDGTVLVEVADPTDLDVSPDGVLVVGTRPGSPLLRFQLDGDSAIELEPVEALGYDGGAVAVAPNGRIAFTTAAGYGWTSGSAARFVSEGRVLTYRLDSGSYLTRWGRLFLDACQPPGTRLGVRFVTTDDDAVLDPTPPSPPARGSRSVPDPQATPPLAPIHLLAAAPDEVPLYRRPTGSERPWLPYQDGYDLQTYECPVSAPPGRYLWVELVLHGTGRSSPRVRALRVERPGHALLGALPRSWSRVEEDASFLFRLLAPAEGMLHDLDEWAAARAVMVNAQGAPSAALDWLAGLAGLVLDQRWPQEAQRTLIAEAYSLFRGRGTRQALIRTLAIYLGYDPTLVEQWQLRGLAGAVLGTRPGSTLPPFIGGSAAQTGSLGRFAIGGSSPTKTTYAVAAHRFKLVVRGNLTHEQRTVVQRILDLHRPAHTLVDICELGDGMRIGDGLRLDLTAYVGPGADWRPAVTGQIRIGTDGVVGRPVAGSRLGETAAVGQVMVG